MDISVTRVLLILALAIAGISSVASAQVGPPVDALTPDRPPQIALEVVNRVPSFYDMTRWLSRGSGWSPVRPLPPEGSQAFNAGHSLAGLCPTISPPRGAGTCLLRQSSRQQSNRASSEPDI